MGNINYANMNKDELKLLSDTVFVDNDTGEIQPQGHRQFNDELINTMATDAAVTVVLADAKTFATQEANTAESNAKIYADELVERIKYISLKFSFSTTTNEWVVTLLNSNLRPDLLKINMAKTVGSESVTIGSLTYDGVNWYGPSIQASLGKNLESSQPWGFVIPFRIEVPYDGVDGPGESRKFSVYNLLMKSAPFVFSVNISCIFK